MDERLYTEEIKVAFRLTEKQSDSLSCQITLLLFFRKTSSLCPP